ncbi:hypothetical protein [Streptomyces sp. NPDC047014]|uniref:hypothetical protein n=1 Tax=Streptomyces sp. NPDC047014 TaxID=3155736 RepID=UPI0033E012C9
MSTPAAPAGPPPPGPAGLWRIRGGDLGPDETAAVLTVLTALLLHHTTPPPPAPPPPRPSWDRAPRVRHPRTGSWRPH